MEAQPSLRWGAGVPRPLHLGSSRLCRHTHHSGLRRFVRSVRFLKKSVAVEEGAGGKVSSGGRGENDYQ